MTRRRLMGTRGGGALVAGLAAFVAATATACGQAEPDVARICTTKTEPPVRVDDQSCERPRSPAEAASHGWYYQQLPGYTYDDDGYADGGGSVVIVGVGQPLYARGQPPPRGGSFTAPPNMSPQRFVPAPPRAGGTVSRGGLGVNGYGSSGT